MNKNCNSSAIIALLVVACLAACTDGHFPQNHGLKNSKKFDNINWKNFMSKATWFTSEVVKASTPYVLQNYPSGNVSDVCTESLKSYVDGIKVWKKWAIRMFDDTGKIPSSFKKGAGIEFGSYDDCIRIDISSKEEPVAFIGQFCMLHLKTTRPYLLEEDTPFKKYASKLIPSYDNTKRVLNYHLGICVPSSCSEQDIYNIVTALTKVANLTASVSNCETKESKELLEPTKYALSALAALLVLTLIGTILDSKDPENGILNTGILHRSLKAFSIRSNIQIPFKKENTNVEIRRISGVLFLWCIWTIVCSTITHPTPWKEMRYTTFRDISMAVRFADSFVVAMDAIFYISGFLSIFIVWKIFEKSGGVIGVFREILGVIFRSSAINGFIILLSFILPLTYYGPLWHQTWNDELVKCQHNGWFTLLNVQTQMSIDDRCWSHTWYSALGMQFFLASLPLLFLLYRYPKIGFSIGILLAAAITITTETTTSTKPLNSFYYFELIRVMVARFYSQPLYYLLPYLLGVLSGWITLHIKEQQLPKVLHAVGWGLSLAICASVLRDDNFPKNNFDQSSLDLIKRTCYLCIALFWILYASIVDGIVGRILSSGAVWPMARMSYCAYMVHTLMITLREAALKERIYIGKLTLTIESTSHVVLSFVLGFIIHVMVELPFTKLYKLYVGSNNSPKVDDPARNSVTSEINKKES